MKSFFNPVQCLIVYIAHTNEMLSVELLCSELWVKMTLSPKTLYQHWETQNHDINSPAIKKDSQKVTDYFPHTKSFMPWLRDLSCSSSPQELDVNFRSCSGAVRQRDIHPWCSSTPTPPPSTFQKEHASGMTGICSREASGFQILTVSGWRRFVF